jgi:hypothetical protein
MKIKLKVRPNSSKDEIKKISEEDYEVWLKEKAENNKANVELVKLLQRFFKRKVKTKSGFNSRNKIVELED